MQVVVILPMLLAAVVAMTKGFRHSLVFVLLPVLLLLPAYYTWKLPGIPIFSFHNYTVLVVACALALGRDRQLLSFRTVDLVVLFYWGWCVASEYENKSFEDARNLAALRGFAIVLPYYIGRAVVQRDALLVATIGMLVVGGAVVGWIAPYEARMGSNPFDFWRRIWPEWVPWDGVLYRSGLRRVAGPFAHAICHGFYFSLVLPLMAWLAAIGKPTSSRARWLLGIGCALGLLCALSRGPILGAVLAFGVMLLGWLRDRLIFAIVGGCMAAFALAFVIDDVVAYISVTRGEARTPEQETAAYRNEMLGNYLAVVEQRPVWGFGKDGFPVVKGQKSIDNQYLLLSLSHGLPSAIAFLATMVVPVLLLLWRLVSVPHHHPLGRLGWALIGILIGAVLTQVTVFAGTQTVEILFLLVGMACGLPVRLRKGAMSC